MQRPTVTVYSASEKKPAGTVALPSVFSTPIRTDVVQMMHAHSLKNLRQPYAVSWYAGEQTSAESWGTGRAVARIPRVGGGGTHRSGQGAFGNMCRGGRMFSPNRVWRRWAHVIKQNEKRFAVASALAASSVAPLVMARGHAVERLREVPLVISNEAEAFTKTKDAVKLLQRYGAFDDAVRVKNTKEIRAGRGKQRNRRYKVRRGPLVVYKNNNGIVRAFRNIPGVEVASVDRMNLLQLAPGGRVGRFVIWTQAAFEDLQKRFGSLGSASGDAAVHRRRGKVYRLPRPILTNTDVTGIIKSDAVQSVARPVHITRRKANSHYRRNPLKNMRALEKLNPYAITEKRKHAIKLMKKKIGADQDKVKKHADRMGKLRVQIAKNFYSKVISPMFAN